MQYYSFADRKKIFSKNAVEGVWLKNPKNVIKFNCKNKDVFICELGVSLDGKIAYTTDNAIYFADEKKAYVKGITKGAFSQNGLTYAYIKKDKLYLCAYENHQIIDCVQLKNTRDMVFKLKYIDHDKYLMVRYCEESFLYLL